MTRVVLVTGKGGVGKTTTAAATAVRAARSGLRTLVMSTDAAHSLGDALDVELRTAQTWRETTEVESHLHALAVGAHTAVEADWQVVRDYLLGVLDAMGVDAVVADELTSLPGAEEVTALAALAHQAASGDWDLVVVDCAPTAETLRQPSTSTGCCPPNGACSPCCARPRRRPPAFRSPAPRCCSCCGRGAS